MTGGHGLFRHAARFEKVREVAAGAQLRDTQFHRAGPRLPVSLTVVIALGKPKGVLRAIGRARLRPDLQLHQLLGGNADHLAQQIRVRPLLNKRAQVHHLVGDRWSSPQVGLEQPDPIGKTPMATPPATPPPGTSSCPLWCSQNLYDADSTGCDVALRLASPHLRASASRARQFCTVRHKER